MRRFSESERLEVEDTIIALIRDYSNNGIMELVLKHGIDSSRYFHNEYNRRIFKIYLEMHKEGFPIFMESFEKYINERYNSNISVKMKIFEKLITTIANPRSYYSPQNADFFIWKFKEMIFYDYWVHIFNMDKNNSWKSSDIIETSWQIVDGFQLLWDKLAKKFEQNHDGSIKEDLVRRVKNTRDGIASSVKTGLTQFDDFTGGFEDTELYIVGGRPSMGKTSWCIALTKRMIRMGKRVLFFSLEMTRTQLINKFVADDLGIDYQRIKRGFLDDDELQRVLDRYDFYDRHDFLFVIQPESNTLGEIYDKLKEIECDIAFVDFLQLVRNEDGVKTKVGTGNREQEVGFVSQSFKKFAKEFKIPLVALCQLSRAAENRFSKRPQLSDLRESGSIEQDADVVIFVHRDAYYQKLAGKPVNPEEEGNLDIIIAKGREIGTGDFKQYLDLKKTTVEEGYRR